MAPGIRHAGELTQAPNGPTSWPEHSRSACCAGHHSTVRLMPLLWASTSTVLPSWANTGREKGLSCVQPQLLRRRPAVSSGSIATQRAQRRAAAVPQQLPRRSPSASWRRPGQRCSPDRQVGPDQGQPGGDQVVQLLDVDDHVHVGVRLHARLPLQQAPVLRARLHASSRGRMGGACHAEHHCRAVLMADLAFHKQLACSASGS